jgi:hypothetical protein
MLIVYATYDNRWNLLFYVAIIHAKARGKVVPLCSIPGTTVEVPLWDSHLTCPSHHLQASFWEEAIITSLMETKCWHIYVDRFIIWLHEDLFLKDLSTIWTSYTLTWNPPWNWKQCQLLFLDVLVTHSPDNSMRFAINRKPTHTNNFLPSTCTSKINHYYISRP